MVCGFEDGEITVEPKREGETPVEPSSNPGCGSAGASPSQNAPSQNVSGQIERGSAGASPSQRSPSQRSPSQNVSGQMERGSAGASPSRESPSRESPSQRPPSQKSRPRSSRYRFSSSVRPERKRPAHGVSFEIGKPTIVFVTACTKGRVPWLATEECHALLRDVWQEAAVWHVGRYVVMPDHIHLFASPDDGDVSFDDWMKFWKSKFRTRHRCSGHRWQAGHWDRRLRSTESYNEKWEYVRHNPVRHGLVADPGEWPFQGDIHELAW